MIALELTNGIAGALMYLVDLNPYAFLIVCFITFLFLVYRKSL